MAAPIDGIHNIQHVVVIMQENRSFDSYFGTYPGANGIPAGILRAGPAQRRLRGAVSRSEQRKLRRSSRPRRFTADLDGGRMDGFIGQAETGGKCKSIEPGCSP